jgi:hypothetical protein
VENGGHLKVSESVALSMNPFWINWEYNHGSRVTLNHYQGDPWTSAHGDVVYTATNASVAHITLFDDMRQSQINVTDSYHAWFEMFPAAGTYELELPKRQQWQSWNPPAMWGTSTFTVTNSYIYDRDISLSSGVRVTVNNATDGLSIGWAMFKFGPGFVECEVRDFGNPDIDAGVMVADQTWDLSCVNSSLRVRNTLVRRFWPAVFGNVRLKVFNSNIVDPSVYGPSTMEIYNSTVDHLRVLSGGVPQGGLAYLENVRVRYDIQVNGAGQIVYGYNVTSRNTSSPFNIFQENGGQYITRTTPGAPWR